MKSQDADISKINFVCIEGGPITQLEQQHIGEIVREAKADNAQKGIYKDFEVVVKSYKGFLEDFDKPMEQLDATIEVAFEKIKLSQYSAFSQTQARQRCPT